MAMTRRDEFMSKGQSSKMAKNTSTSDKLFRWAATTSRKNSTFTVMLKTPTYNTGMWTITVRLVRKLKLTQRTIERAMFDVSLKDKVRNVIIRK